MTFAAFFQYPHIKKDSRDFGFNFCPVKYDLSRCFHTMFTLVEILINWHFIGRKLTQVNVKVNFKIFNLIRRNKSKNLKVRYILSGTHFYSAIYFSNSPGELKVFR